MRTSRPSNQVRRRNDARRTTVALARSSGGRTMRSNASQMPGGLRPNQVRRRNDARRTTVALARSSGARTMRNDASQKPGGLRHTRPTSFRRRTHAGRAAPHPASIIPATRPWSQNMPCVTMKGDFPQIQGGRQISLSHPESAGLLESVGENPIHKRR